MDLKTIPWLALLPLACQQPFGSGVDSDLDEPRGDAGQRSDADRPSSDGRAEAEGGSAAPETIGPAERRVELLPPRGEDTFPAPLALLLHGYGPSEESFAFLVAVGERLREEGFFVVIPEGTQDSSGYRFWNAGEVCCDREGIGVDDVAYLRALLLEATALDVVDASRASIFGHSNGGLMAYRMACEAEEHLAAIASLAAPDPAPEGVCVPARPPSVLHIHGDADEVVPFVGGPLGEDGAAVIGAEESLRRWAAYAGCDLDAAVAAGERDYEATIAGPETLASAYDEGCALGAAFELWTIRGGSHRPEPTPAFFDDLATWLAGRRRAP